MSTGEALKSAVRQRLAGVLEEVLVLIQNTVDQYEAQLQRGRLREEQSEGLRGLSVRLQLTEPEEHEKEQSHIKEEEPDIWSRDPASGPKTATSNAHDNHPPAHKTEPEDSDGEECPICRQQPLTSSETNEAVPGPTSRVEENRASNPEEALDSMDFEIPQIKTEEEDQGYADSALLNFTDDEPAEDGARATNDLKRAAADWDQGVAPKVSKTQEERAETEATSRSETDLEKMDSQEERTESCDATERVGQEREGSMNQDDENLGQFSRSAEDKLSTNEQTSEAMEQENYSEKETQRDSQNTNQISDSVEQGLEAKSDVEDPKSHENESVGDGGVESKGREDCSAQTVVRKRPTVRLVPLKIAEKPERKSTNRKKALGLRRLLEKKTANGGKEMEQDAGNVDQLREKKVEILVSDVGEDEPSSSSKKALQKSRKGEGEGSEGFAFRRRLNRKAKTKARRVKLREANGDSGSASDTDAGDDSDFKMENESDSGESEDEGRSRSKKGKSRMFSVRQSGQSHERQGPKHQQLRPDKGPNGASLDKNKAMESPQNVNTQSGALTSENDDAMSKRFSPNKETNAPDVRQNGAGGPQKAEEGANDTQNGRSKSSKPKRKRREGRHECPECGNVFSLKRNLQLHLAVHSDERPFACDRCDSTFKRQLNLKAHMSIHAEEKEFQCSVCEKRFTRKAGLDDHLKSHSGVKPYSCSVCTRSFSCRSNLRRHMASHAGLRPFECEVCGKKFGRRSILSEHMTGHTGERAFDCTVCGTKFSRKHNLLKHLRIHRGDRRYRCEDCGARFCQKAHLNQHMRQHTGEKPFSCGVCQKAFTRKAYVQQHLEMYCTGNREERERREREGQKGEGQNGEGEGQNGEGEMKKEQEN